MKIKDSKVEDIIYNIHRDVPHLDLKKGIDAYHSVKHYEHNLRLKLRHIELYSVKTATLQRLELKTDTQHVIFKREKREQDFNLILSGEGDIIDSVVETCSLYEMRKVEKDIYIVEEDKLLYAKPHLNGYLLKDVERGDCNRYMTCKDMYELYATVPHTIMEEKLILLKGGSA